MRALLPAAVLLLALAGCGDRPADAGGAAAPPPATAARGEVAGVVRTADGRPLGGALVVPRSLDTPAEPIPELAVVTDRAGGYRWTLPPGRYELSVRLGERRPVPARTVTVEAGRTATVDW
ncbi:MAG: hypothetical protein AVDCRST_MAG41-2471 [uncultured Corynebacteriales bacterium]|uniref:Carboxypeptidase regulatory-like domain-containing protein n=1 Tax=uncultured Mycobacteriales bacterium TaxID=581187 RepID=A0A6J4IXE7_9ACTN|nr:MAG: hypothetical protein AVDCRST_MAG41-2471 [uncultured Corynebacteriales bacterium]